MGLQLQQLIDWEPERAREFLYVPQRYVFFPAFDHPHIGPVNASSLSQILLREFERDPPLSYCLAESLKDIGFHPREGVRNTTIVLHTTISVLEAQLRFTGQLLTI
jgi:hypothetical protein